MKRILREVRELAQNADLAIFAASPLEDNLFEWLFAVSGPPGTEFAGGVYLGRILLPPEYPMRPPAFAFLTPNGRFETGVRVCLSISQHHPEEWQPSWGVRTALTALQAFLPTPGRGAVGSLDLKPEERRKLAARSRDPGGVAELLGSAKEDKLSLAAELHRLVLEHASEAGVSSPGGGGGGGGGGRGQRQRQRQRRRTGVRQRGVRRRALRRRQEIRLLRGIWRARRRRRLPSCRSRTSSCGLPRRECSWRSSGCWPAGRGRRGRSSSRS